MQLPHSVIESHAAPPEIFTPGGMLDCGLDREDWLDIELSSPTISIVSTVSSSKGSVQISSTGAPNKVVALVFQVRTKEHSQPTTLRIPFEVVTTDNGEITLSSERQPTPWSFLITVDATSKQMNLRLRFDYAGLRVAEALAGVLFYQSLATSGELHILGQHPTTGEDLPIAKARIPSGMLELPDSRFVQILKQLSFIESKTGVSFTIPEGDIGFEEADKIAATSHILETGHAEYEAKPWVSVSDVLRVRRLLESYEAGKAFPIAIHFENQTVMILGTPVRLGPVTLFCDRTYITEEDFENLRNEIEGAAADTSLSLRLTSFEDSVVEARYINWLPKEEAIAIRQLPMYTDQPHGGEDRQPLPPMDTNSALALLRSWYDEDPDEQKNSWEQLKAALDQDRLSERKLFS